MRLRPTEVRAVAEVLQSLSGTGADVDDVAGAVIRKLDEMRATGRDHYAILAQEEGGPILVYGPYGTPRAAEKAAGTLVAPTKGRRYAAAAFKLYRIPEETLW